MEAATVEDCLENYYRKKKISIINDGKLIGFEQEEIPTQAANPSGDNK